MSCSVERDEEQREREEQLRDLEEKVRELQEECEKIKGREPTRENIELYRFCFHNRYEENDEKIYFDDQTNSVTVE